MAAAAREAEEEVGIKIEESNMTFSTVLHRMEQDREDERVDFFVHVLQWEGEPFNAEPDKCDELRWTNVHELPPNTIPYIRKALNNHIGNIPFDEFG